MTFVENRNAGSLADTTPVIVVDSPIAGVRRLIRYISIHNKDVSPVLLTLTNDITGVPYIIYRGTLAVGDTFVFGDGGETIVLDDIDQTVSAVLDGAVASEQPEFVATYAEVTT